VVRRSRIGGLKTRLRTGRQPVASWGRGRSAPSTVVSKRRLPLELRTFCLAWLRRACFLGISRQMGETSPLRNGCHRSQYRHPASTESASTPATDTRRPLPSVWFFARQPDSHLLKRHSLRSQLTRSPSSSDTVIGSGALQKQSYLRRMPLPAALRSQLLLPQPHSDLAQTESFLSQFLG